MNFFPKSPFKFSPQWAGIFLLVFIVTSLWLIFEYAEKERNRDLIGWQSRLALLAELRAGAVEDWISNRKKLLHQLANNASLKLFLSEHENKFQNDKTQSNQAQNNQAKGNQAILNAQQAHVRNLLRASANRFGFAENDATINNLNINNSREYGLAILGAQQQLIMATKGFSKNIDKNKRVIQKAYISAKAQVIDLYAGERQQPVYGYVIPVFKIQDTKLEKPVGAIMLLLNPQKNLYKILQNKQSVTKTDESILVKRAGPSLVYISPLQGELNLFHQLPDNNNQLAASYAFHNPGGFSKMRDYRGEQVLVTGRKINNSANNSASNSDWTLVQKISATEALSESNEHQKFLFTSFILIVLIIAAAFIAIWRHSTSVRLQLLSLTLQRRTALLDAVTNNVQENIILLDENQQVEFINSSLANVLSVEADEIKYKKINSVLGKQTAERLMSCARDQNHARVMSLILEGVERIYHVTANKLLVGKHQNDTLFVLHDISELKAEQEKREQLGKGIIGTLVKAVDLHDPHCANHSARTREVAMAIGKEMQLDEAQLEALEMAALLANIGKLFVAKEILIKMQALTDEESAALKKHIEYAVDILSELTFNGPVVDIISQKSERLDGSGYPKALKGDDIRLESKILAVADAFVAMASARAYREGRKVKEVVDILLAQSESKYDRHVVAALFHISENRADWQTWQSI